MAVNKLKTLTKVKKAEVKVKVKKIAKKTSVYKEKHSRADILKILSDNSGLTKVQLEQIFHDLKGIIAGHLNKRGSGEVILPFLGLKLRRIKKKATKERKMVSPLTGTEVTIAAKPAANAVKASALKSLKELVG